MNTSLATISNIGYQAIVAAPQTRGHFQLKYFTGIIICLHPQSQSRSSLASHVVLRERKGIWPPLVLEGAELEKEYIQSTYESI